MKSTNIGVALALLCVCTPVLGQVLTPTSASSAQVPPPAITWQVQDRFRLWSAAGAPSQDVNRLLGQLVGLPSADAAHQNIVTFLRGHRDLWRHVPWDETVEGYAASYLFPNQYSVVMGFPSGSIAGNATCKWSTDVGVLQQTNILCANSANLTLPAASAGGSALAHVAVDIVWPDGTNTSQTTTIQVRDRVIVSIGDSFASGEGNPDVPADLGALNAGPGVDPIGETDSWLGSATDGVKMAHWQGPACHRSFYNQHLVAALKLAADRPHEAVTFASYACSGAAIFNGLLAPQVSPPGVDDGPNIPAPKYAQIEAAARDLCVPNGGADRYQPKTINFQQPRVTRSWLGEYSYKMVPGSTAGFACSNGSRKPDAILLSIGGNDVYFGPIIMGRLLPEKLPISDGLLASVALSVARAKLAKEDYDSVIAQDNLLNPSLPVLHDRLDAVASAVPVFQSAYPSPLKGDSGQLCGPQQDPTVVQDIPALRRLAAPQGIWANVSVLHDWMMSVSVDDELKVNMPVIGALNDDLSTRAGSWTYVVSYLPKFDRHGWCAGDGVVEKADLPRWNGVTWTNWNPSSWDPYAPSSRYFRTPNDSVLTEIQEQIRQPELPLVPIKKRQYLLLNALAGSFHPTFQAHVVMGLDLGLQLAAKLPPEL